MVTDGVANDLVVCAQEGHGARIPQSLGETRRAFHVSEQDGPEGSLHIRLTGLVLDYAAHEPFHHRLVHLDDLGRNGTVGFAVEPPWTASPLSAFAKQNAVWRS